MRRTLYGADAPEVRSRRIATDGKNGAVEFERVEDGRLLRYRFDEAPGRLTARRLDPEAASAPAGEAAPTGTRPAGLLLLGVRPASEGPIESANVARRLEAMIGGGRPNMEAEVPRALLQRPVRADLAASLLADGRLAALGVAEHSLVARREAARALQAMRDALATRASELRVEELPGPFLWHF